MNSILVVHYTCLAAHYACQSVHRAPVTDPPRASREWMNEWMNHTKMYDWSTIVPYSATLLRYPTDSALATRSRCRGKVCATVLARPASDALNSPASRRGRDKQTGFTREGHIFCILSAHVLPHLVICCIMLSHFDIWRRFAHIFPSTLLMGNRGTSATTPFQCSTL